MIKENEAYNKLVECGIRPSVQRLAIMEYLLTHFTHPTVDDIYNSLSKKIKTLSRTTVYNTLRMLAEHHAAQMLTIDDHHICYDGRTEPHAHFICKECGKLVDLFDIDVPNLNGQTTASGDLIDDSHLYFRGVCANCQAKNARQQAV